MKSTTLGLSLLSVLYLSACQTSSPGSGLLGPRSPRDRYLKELKRTNEGLSRQWEEAGKNALDFPVSVKFPHKEQNFFPTDLPLAFGYRVTIPRGRRLEAVVSSNPADSLYRVFLELYEESGDKYKRLTFAEADSNRLAWEAPDSTTVIVHLQSEAAQTADITVSLESHPMLSFPVARRDSRNIISFWGMARDGGRRSHEGIDVAAPRGTPVVAAANGYISSVGVNNLGGNVIFQQVENGGITLYYAHLDSQMAVSGQRVSIGDTIGTVGNTGNAITTGPHLHFGIYQSFRSAIDPLPFLSLPQIDHSNSTLPDKQAGEWKRVAGKTLDIRTGPEAARDTVARLSRNTMLRVVGKAGAWYKIWLPDGKIGYAEAKSISPSLNSLRPLTVDRERPLWMLPSLDSYAVIRVPAQSTLKILGSWKTFLYVEEPTGKRGWLNNPAALPQAIMAEGN
ncbi:peptidoglycan DD-metalloendopeptidase family protein [Runella slithyformis]|uniref:Peptidase M23 n=1 Tax=Runella slithyformis (strain ATCC 29530 / DSM 19594 / LMG 11500 / NCIMB 11436 / LSU 4) TaxID=761193 RepID=A0A7U3ZIM7_RUNSL|nr:peptidoglycan DD-metalloendopeptidase family protein [Runella slithyformis]AEI47845.1 Peptidase M23 [Runella slithyformis DSM 19594]